MGLGSSEPQKRIFFLSPRGTDKDKKLYPHFKVQVKENGAYRDLQDETSVSGYLVSIGHGKYEWPKGSGDWNRTIIVTLADGDDLFKIEANVQSGNIRSLMNSILGTRDFGVMKISLYAKNENANIFVTNDGEKTAWKYDYEKDIKPKIVEVPDPKKPGKTVKVYHAVDEMLWNDWLLLEPYIAERARKMGYVQSAAATTSEATTQASGSIQEAFDKQEAPPIHTASDAPPMGDSNDDLPF